MDLFGLEKEHSVVYKGTFFTFKPINHDVSGQFEKDLGEVILTHKISGFNSGSIYMFVDSADGVFFFGKKIIDTGSQTMFASIDDEKLIEKATDLVVSVGSAE